MSDNPENLTPAPQPEEEEQEEEQEKEEPEEKPEEGNLLKIWMTEVNDRLKILENSHAAQKTQSEELPTQPKPQPPTQPQPPKRKRPPYRWWFQKD